MLNIEKRLDIQKEENELLRADIDDLSKKLDVAHEANYLLEGDLYDAKEKIARLELELENRKVGD